jgi:hypothetical protein
MIKRILYFGSLVLISFIMCAPDLSAGIWERHNTTVRAESLLAAIERGDKIMMSSCRIRGTLVKEGTAERVDSIWSYIGIVESVFPGPVCFKYCCFMDQVYLSCDTFMCADFSYSTFTRKCSFNLSTFRYTLFTGTSFSQDVDFSGVAFGGTAVFHNTDFAKEVYLGVADFGSMYMSWTDLKGHLVYNRSYNYDLMKFWEEKRQFGDADGLYLFLKNHERMEKPKLWRYLEYWLLQQTCGYGVRPENVFVLSVLIIICFALLYTNRNAIREMEEKFGCRRKRIALRNARRSLKKRLNNAFYFSVQTFIIGVVSDLYATDEFLIRARRMKRLKFRTFSMIEGALGWVLLVLFVVTLTRKFIR